MAPNTNNEGLRQHALRALAESRAEISVEVHHVRREFSPVRVLRRLVDRHAGLVVFLAVTAAIVPALLIFRGMRSGHRARLPLMITGAKAPPKPVLGALLLGALGMLARSVAPALIKSAVIPHVLDFLSKKQAAAAQNKRAE
jgi:hypothetical protein